MIKKLQALKAKKGFTLVELVVVIAIIGVLAAILVPTMLGVVQDSRITSANSTAQQVKDRTTEFLTKMDAAKTGYVGSGTVVTLVVDKTSTTPWSLSTTTPTTPAKGEAGFDAPAADDWLDNGKTGAVNHWGTTANPATAAGVNNKDTQFVHYIADSLSDLSTAYIKIYISAQGKVIGVVAVDGSASAPTVSDGSMPNGAAFTAGKNNWGSAGKAGALGNIVVGCSPALPHGT